MPGASATSGPDVTNAIPAKMKRKAQEASADRGMASLKIRRKNSMTKRAQRRKKPPSESEDSSDDEKSSKSSSSSSSETSS